MVNGMGISSEYDGNINGYMLVGGFKYDFYFPFHIWDNPSH